MCSLLKKTNKVPFEKYLAFNSIKLMGVGPFKRHLFLDLIDGRSGRLLVVGLRIPRRPDLRTHSPPSVMSRVRLSVCCGHPSVSPETPPVLKTPSPAIKSFELTSLVLSVDVCPILYSPGGFHNNYLLARW